MRRSALILMAFLVLACSAPTYRYGNTIRVKPLSEKEAGRLLSGAKNHLGEPYRFGGTTSEGWDCSGFASEMYHRYLSYSLPRNTESLYSRSVKIPASRKKPGDLVFFKIEGKRPSHVGIYMGQGHFIHASTSSGVIVSSLREDYYRESFVGFRRPVALNASGSQPMSVRQ